MTACAHRFCEKPADTLVTMRTGPMNDLDVVDIKFCADHAERVRKAGQLGVLYVYGADELVEKGIEL